MVNKLYVLRGVPGSGKSTLAEKLKNQKFFTNVYSTDSYWIRPDGKYDFNPKLISNAHDWNYKQFTEIFYDSDPPFIIIVDNTNTTYWELKRYVEYAVSANPKIDIVLLEPDTEWKFNASECAKKNSHGVGEETIMRMLNRWQSSQEIKELIEREYGCNVTIQIGDKVHASV